ncbi:MAG: hypothetical protein US52_C0010G0003 [candidate division WS6 bacterium GW2011_GWA2_37_6]|uniref:Uncharacterized protein n=1 Tax=candidate division WS6 bacterium GW2011_GWA2_37_6 TaxID=1619087 RepID=A0A0G0GYJ4_9BACT|nr:MAG: hypothetical protein US52_C0010G0003 [candidate division WS6 bacterium GW2011_GWA2_37_6]
MIDEAAPRKIPLRHNVIPIILGLSTILNLNPDTQASQNTDLFQTTRQAGHITGLLENEVLPYTQIIKSSGIVQTDVIPSAISREKPQRQDNIDTIITIPYAACRYDQERNSVVYLDRGVDDYAIDLNQFLSEGSQTDTSSLRILSDPVLREKIIRLEYELDNGEIGHLFFIYWGCRMEDQTSNPRLMQPQLFMSATTDSNNQMSFQLIEDYDIINQTVRNPGRLYLVHTIDGNVEMQVPPVNLDAPLSVPGEATTIKFVFIPRVIYRRGKQVIELRIKYLKNENNNSYPLLNPVVLSNNEDPILQELFRQIDEFNEQREQDGQSSA